MSIILVSQKCLTHGGEQDFAVIVKNDENPQGGRPSTDYVIKLDMAKEIAMIQRNEKGKQAR